jgi:hypothetical protein
MEIGPNMRRLIDSATNDSLETCVVAGPGDLLVWEVRVKVEADGIPLEVSGRGTDLEAAAAAAMPLLTSHAGDMFGQAEISRSE